MSPFQCFVEFNAIKQHFTTNYNYFKYNGKLNITYQTFEKNNAHKLFISLSKKNDVKNLILSNILKNTEIFVTDLLTSDANRVYNEHMKRLESLFYTFKEDLSKIEMDAFKGKSPKLLKMFMRDNISIQTFTILYHECNLKKRWQDIDDKFIYPTIEKKIINYRPFLNYDSNKYKEAIIDRFSITKT